MLSKTSVSKLLRLCFPLPSWCSLGPCLVEDDRCFLLRLGIDALSKSLCETVIKSPEYSKIKLNVQLLLNSIKWNTSQFSPIKKFSFYN